MVQLLDGAWRLRQVDSKEICEAQVPSWVHLDLMRAGKIDDPFYGDNDYKVAWVHEADWEYSRRFKADADLFDADKVYLECDGLDTIAEVTLNGSSLGCVDNMHRFNITSILRRGENDLYIRFVSSVKFIKPLIEKDPLVSPGDSIPGSIYMRKSSNQWGWNWGPKIPTSGIWRPIQLAAYHIARTEDVRVRQHHNSGRVKLDVEVFLEEFCRKSCSVTVRLTHPDGSVEEHDAVLKGSMAACSIDVAHPQLWWPNGYGDHPLYNVEAVLKHDGEKLQTFSRRIGIRTIELEQKDDCYGRGFTFVVNGVKIFCKGANWVPADQFPSRITDQRYRHLVSSCARANMNMLRVWGGGFYEDERFYDLCNEYGIMVWQDFMFSCAHYPVDERYLDNVSREVEYNVKRLRSRACLALWCGNNEMEWGCTDWWKDEKKESRKKQYLIIFHQLIPSIVSKLDPDRPYWPSSPSSGTEKPFPDPLLSVTDIPLSKEL